MKVRAAVLEEFGRPLAVQEVELAEPQAGEALVRLEACGVCHTDLYAASGADPTGYTRVRARPRGRGRRRARRAGREPRRPGRPRRHAVRSRVRRVRPLPQPADEPLRRDPRPAGPRLPARRDDALRAERRAAAPLHGHLHLRRVHGDARRSRWRRSTRKRRSTAARPSPAASRPASAPRSTRPR